MQGSDMNVADAIVDQMVVMGIRAVFGIPGGAVEPLYNALTRASSAGRLRLVTARHEAGASFMAYGWWLETGRPAAVVTTTGPGAVNALAGAACANAEGAPMLVVTGQVASHKQGRPALQECSSFASVDTVGLYKACTVFSGQITHAAQLPAAMAKACARMHGDPCGPAHLAVPTDVLWSKAPALGPNPPYAALMRAATPPVDARLLSEAVGRLEGSSQPVVLLGDGAEPAVRAALALAERLAAPVCASPSIAGAACDRHPLFRGRFGFGGHAEARLAVEAADVILTVATSGAEFEAAAWGPHAARSIHLSDSRACLSRMPEALLSLHGPLAPTLASIRKRLTARKGQSGTAAWRPEPVIDAQATPVDPPALIRALCEGLPEGAALYADAGNAAAWAIHHLHAERDWGRLRLSLHYASMGWASGAAVGAALAGKRPTVALIGDGAMLMTGQEFSVAVQHRRSCVFVVFNDSALGMVRHGQRLGGGGPIEADLPSTDFAAMARAMGGRGLSASTAAQLKAIDWPALFARGEPTVVDVRIDPEAVPPMQERVKALLNVDAK